MAVCSEAPNSLRRRLLGVALALGLSGCAAGEVFDPAAKAPDFGPVTATALDLGRLPETERPIPITLFEFPDLTGQHRQTERYADFSRAVTQGGLTIVIDALKRSCAARCFRVIERSALKNLLQERQIIQATRAEHQGSSAGKLPPLLFAGVMIEGAIVGYDSNTLTGGAGAKYLGLGGDAKYRQDVVTVGMRLVSVSTGEVLKSLTTTKTIYSVSAQAHAFRYVALDRLLEAEVGMTRNEPPQLATRQAIELAVYALIMEGARDGLWSFKDKSAGKLAVEDYMRRAGSAAEPKILEKPKTPDGSDGASAHEESKT
ncbi:MAG: CsgG/HfaB family protein [Beijerinckiaceae bacterium]